MTPKDETDFEVSDELVGEIVELVKARGLFDNIRHEVMNDIESKPYTNTVKQLVENSVDKYLSDVKWNYSLNKNDLRNKIRNDVLQGNNINESVKDLVEHTIDLDLQSHFSLKFLKFLEKLFLNEKHIPDHEFYFAIKNEFINVPPLPPSPPKEPALPPPPLPPLPPQPEVFEDNKPDILSMFGNVSDYASFPDGVTAYESVPPPNALEALDLIKNKLAQLINTGDLDINALDINLGKILDSASEETQNIINNNTMENEFVPSPNLQHNFQTVASKEAEVEVKVKKEEEKINKPVVQIGEGSLAHEILKTVDSAGKIRGSYESNLFETLNKLSSERDSKLQIDKEDISVSSVHTSDLSSLDDQISISSSDLPEIGEEEGIPNPTAAKPKLIMGHVYNYLLGGHLFPGNAGCRDYYQNIACINKLLQEECFGGSSSSRFKKDEDDLLKDLTDHSITNYSAGQAFTFKGCPRLFEKSICKFKSPLKSTSSYGKSESESIERKIGKKLKYYEDAVSCGTTNASHKSQGTTAQGQVGDKPGKQLFQPHVADYNNYPDNRFLMKRKTSPPPLFSTPPLEARRFDKKTKAEIIAEAYKPKSSSGNRNEPYLHLDKDRTSEHSKRDDIPFDEFYEKRANIKPATSSVNKRHKNKNTDIDYNIDDDELDKNIHLPTVKVRERLKQDVYTRNSTTIFHSNPTHPTDLNDYTGRFDELEPIRERPFFDNTHPPLQQPTGPPYYQKISPPLFAKENQSSHNYYDNHHLHTPDNSYKDRVSFPSYNRSSSYNDARYSDDNSYHRHHDTSLPVESKRYFVSPLEQQQRHLPSSSIYEANRHNQHHHDQHFQSSYDDYYGGGSSSSVGDGNRRKLPFNNTVGTDPNISYAPDTNQLLPRRNHDYFSNSAKSSYWNNRDYGFRQDEKFATTPTTTTTTKSISPSRDLQESKYHHHHAHHRRDSFTKSSRSRSKSTANTMSGDNVLPTTIEQRGSTSSQHQQPSSSESRKSTAKLEKTKAKKSSSSKMLQQPQRDDNNSSRKKSKTASGIHKKSKKFERYSDAIATTNNNNQTKERPTGNQPPSPPFPSDKKGGKGGSEDKSFEHYHHKKFHSSLLHNH